MRRTLRILASFSLIVFLAWPIGWVPSTMYAGLCDAAEQIGLVSGDARTRSASYTEFPWDGEFWVLICLISFSQLFAVSVPYALGLVIVFGPLRRQPHRRLSQRTRLTVAGFLYVAWYVFAPKYLPALSKLLVLSLAEAWGFKRDGPRGQGDEVFVIGWVRESEYLMDPFYQIYHAIDLVVPALTGYFLFLIAYVVLGVMKKWPNDQPRCAGCGYPLDGLEHHTCPECGSPVRAPGQPE